MPRKLIIDADPGIGDALAIALAFALACSGAGCLMFTSIFKTRPLKTD